MTSAAAAVAAAATTSSLMHSQLVNAYHQSYTSYNNNGAVVNQAVSYPITPPKDSSATSGGDNANKLVELAVGSIKTEAKQMEMISPINSVSASHLKKSKLPSSQEISSSSSSSSSTSGQQQRRSKKRSIDSVEDHNEADEGELHQQHRSRGDEAAEDELHDDSKFENITQSENEEDEDDDEEEEDDEEEDEGNESGEVDSSNRHTSNSDTSNSLSSPSARNNYAWTGNNNNNNENDYAHAYEYESAAHLQQQHQSGGQDVKYKWGSKVASGGGGASGKHKKGMPLPGSLIYLHNYLNRLKNIYKFTHSTAFFSIFQYFKRLIISTLFLFRQSVEKAAN
jgi:hypothetical protein